jgi:D-serine deaminase-like pyridoxal phosphate-dependent protein
MQAQPFDADARYRAYKAAFAGQRLPFAFVDLDLLDANIQAIGQRAGDKTVRVASKSVRSVDMLRRILAGHPAMRGLMTFTARETVWLSQQGFDDLLLAYPCWAEADILPLCEEIRQGKSITVMLDSPAHATQLARCAEIAQVEIPVCIDLDMSLKLPGLHFGVLRSPVRDVQGALALWAAIRKHPRLRCVGLMGYEAQVAGLGDDVPGMGIKGPLVRLLKRRSIRAVADRRAAVVRALRDAGAPLTLVNGGGTGSMEFTRTEAAVTEITAGSGFFASHLFDYYRNFRHQPAAGYAVEIVRQPAPGVFTCLGGGYTASGSPGPEKAPLPYLPAGTRLHPNEGAGEVQTPILYKGGIDLQLGYPVFLRHSKAGELCERFQELVLLQGGKLIGAAKTYRGDGQCFL